MIVRRKQIKTLSWEVWTLDIWGSYEMGQKVLLPSNLLQAWPDVEKDVPSVLS